LYKQIKMPNQSGKSAAAATPMTAKAASNIQSSGAKNPSGATHQSGFDARAQAAAAKNAK